MSKHSCLSPEFLPALEVTPRPDSRVLNGSPWPHIADSSADMRIYMHKRIEHTYIEVPYIEVP